jgi:hypothetical protein
MIIDNVDDEDTLLNVRTNVLPSPIRGQVLITGRLAQLSDIKTPIEIPLMSISESKNLFKSYCLEKYYVDPQAENLVHTLGRLPLAIEQAALYISRNGKSIKEYFELFKAREMMKLLWQEDPAALHSKSKPLLVVWNISLENVTSKSVNAKNILYLLSFLPANGVTERFLRRGARHHPTGRWPLTDSLPDFDRGIELPKEYGFLSSLADTQAAINALVKVALINSSLERLSIHPVSYVVDGC